LIENLPIKIRPLGGPPGGGIFIGKFSVKGDFFKKRSYNGALGRPTYVLVPTDTTFINIHYTSMSVGRSPK